ncbi:MAG: hypothetical protein EOO87_06460 [Pedobacter sp.]|nr:MAG: hypothetical protein EOO87_06460 [Pedobacter sp.]
MGGLVAMKIFIIFSVFLFISTPILAQTNFELNTRMIEGIVSNKEKDIITYMSNSGLSGVRKAREGSGMKYSFVNKSKIGVEIFYFKKGNGAVNLIIFDTFYKRTYNQFREKLLNDNTYLTGWVRDYGDVFYKVIGSKIVMISAPSTNDLKPLIDVFIENADEYKPQRNNPKIEIPKDTIPLLTFNYDNGYKLSDKLPLTFYSKTQRLVFSKSNDSLKIDISPLENLSKHQHFSGSIQGNIITIEGVESFLSFSDSEGALYLNDRNRNYIQLKQKRE